MDLNEEIREDVRQLFTCEDEDVRDSADIIARRYRQERTLILGLLNVDLMVAGDHIPPDENDPRLVAVRERLRDRLKALVEWTRATGRLG